jgi:hypothetical protein
LYSVLGDRITARNGELIDGVVGLTLGADDLFWLRCRKSQLQGGWHQLTRVAMGLNPALAHFPDWSCSLVAARLARRLSLLIEHRRWTHCGVESIANLRKRLADYTHSAHRLLA